MALNRILETGTKEEEWSKIYVNSVEAKTISSDSLSFSGAVVGDLEVNGNLVVNDTNATFLDITAESVVFNYTDTIELKALTGTIDNIYAKTIEVDGSLSVSGTSTFDTADFKYINTDTLQATTIINVNEIEVKDTLIHLGIDNPADTNNLGYMEEWNDGAKKYSGIIRSKDDKKHYLLEGLTTKPTPTSNITAEPKGDLEVKELISQSITNGGYVLPLMDGTPNQIIETDGAGNLSFVDLAGGLWINTASNSQLIPDYDLVNTASNLVFGDTHTIPINPNYYGNSVFGFNNEITGASSFYNVIGGRNCVAEGKGSALFGDGCQLNGSNNSFVAGIANIANVGNSFLMGTGNQTNTLGGSACLGDTNTSNSSYSFSHGRLNVNNGNYSHAEGRLTTTQGQFSHSEGDTTIAQAEASHSEGYGTISAGVYSHAEGYLTTSSGDYSHSEGRDTTALGVGAHAEGLSTECGGLYNHTEGYLTFIDTNSSYSHAQGVSNTMTSCNQCWVSGTGNNLNTCNNTIVSGNTNTANNATESFIQGAGCSVSGDYCMVIGNNNDATADACMVLGGLNNICSSYGSACIASSTGRASGNYSAVIASFDTRVGGNYSCGIGQRINIPAGATDCVALGRNHEFLSSVQNAIAVGQYSNVEHDGSFVHSPFSGGTTTRHIGGAIFGGKMDVVDTLNCDAEITTFGGIDAQAGQNLKVGQTNATEVSIGNPTNNIVSNGALLVEGGYRMKRTFVESIDSPYTIFDNDYILGVNTTTGAVNINLPDAFGIAGRTLHIVDEAGTSLTNNITISASGADLINGSATAVINTGYSSFSIYSNGLTGWHIF